MHVRCSTIIPDSCVIRIMSSCLYMLPDISCLAGANGKWREQDLRGKRTIGRSNGKCGRAECGHGWLIFMIETTPNGGFCCYNLFCLSIFSAFNLFSVLICLAFNLFSFNLLRFNLFIIPLGEGLGLSDANRRVQMNLALPNLI